MQGDTYHASEAEVLDKLFNYISKNGLENITIRNLCNETGLVQGTLYYWFNDKTTMICEASEYGLKKSADKIFEYAVSNMDNLKDFFDNCLSEIGRQRDELRFIYQMAASPIYGKKIRKDGHALEEIYDRYSERLAEALNCDAAAIRPAVYIFISAVLDYIIWDNAEKTKVQLDFIYEYISGLTS